MMDDLLQDHLLDHGLIRCRCLGRPHQQQIHSPLLVEGVYNVLYSRITSHSWSTTCGPALKLSMASLSTVPWISKILATCSCGLSATPCLLQITAASYWRLANLLDGIRLCSRYPWLPAFRAAACQDEMAHTEPQRSPVPDGPRKFPPLTLAARAGTIPSLRLSRHWHAGAHDMGLRSLERPVTHPKTDNHSYQPTLADTTVPPAARRHIPSLLRIRKDEPAPKELLVDPLWPRWRRWLTTSADLHDLSRTHTYIVSCE